MARARLGVTTFTVREGDVLALLQKRLSNKRVASALGMSELTAKFHVANIVYKLRIHDRSELPDIGMVGDKSPQRFSSEVLLYDRTA